MKQILCEPKMLQEPVGEPALNHPLYRIQFYALSDADDLFRIIKVL